jgi:hypothetical protein
VEQLPLPGVEEHLKKHPLQPHQMSRAQYEADPQTMWRAEGSDTVSAFSGQDWSGQVAGGLHFGDYSAAVERGESIAERYDHLESPRPVRIFSLRTKGRFSNEPVASHPAAEVLPQTKGVAPDADVGDDPWPQRRTGRWYLNDYEGYNLPTTTVGGVEYVNKAQRYIGRQSDVLSGYVPRREGFLTTHKEEVLKANDEGKSVHPTILQEAQIGPEYSETIEPAKPVDHKEGVRTLARPEHPAKSFQTLNPDAGKAEHIDIPTIGGGVIKHVVNHSHAIHVSNEDYDEALRKHHANKTGESNEPILSHIGKPRPAGSSR